MKILKRVNDSDRKKVKERKKRIMLVDLFEAVKNPKKRRIVTAVAVK